MVFFHYRGSWGSGGRFSFAGVLEDVAAVVARVGEPGFAAEHRIDPARIALVGHSMGGFAALMSASELDAVDCVASLAGANLGATAKVGGDDPRVAEGMARSLDAWSGPVVGPGGAALVREVVENADRFDTFRRAPALARKSVLLVAGRLDDVTPVTLHHDPLVDLLERAGAASLRTRVFEEGDHSFSGQRIALAREVTAWLRGECSAAAS